MPRSLDLRWATHAAAAYACRHWHYSTTLPTGKLVRIAVHEAGAFVGVVIFSRGASPWLPRQFGMGHADVAELTRVALRRHAAPVSRILAIAVRMLRKRCPGVRVLVSFADPHEGHVGTIYQAAGWIYSGRSNETIEYLVGGRWRHKRGVYCRTKGTTIPQRTRRGKFRYLLPLDDQARALAEARRRPYPKDIRAGSVDSDAPGHPPGEGGATPTPALQFTTNREGSDGAAE